MLTEKHAQKYKERREYAKIMTYIQEVNQIIKHAERTIKKKYKKLIYSKENALNFDV